MSYHGDIRLGDTIDIKFTTRRFTTGAPHTLAGSPAVAAYVGNGTTEITAGITLTVDFDSRTGLNNVRVVASGGNGFATATNVMLVITAGTVDSVSVVGEIIGEFSIENRSAVMPTTAARTLDITATGAAGIDWGNIENQTTAVGLTNTTVKTATDVEADTQDIQGRLPATLSSGRMRSDVEAVGANTTVVTNLGVVYNTDFGNNYNTTDDKWVVKLGNVAHGGAAGTLTLTSIVVSTASGSAVTFSSTGANGNGLVLTGHGFGSGLSAEGGASGNGALLVGGATVGRGLYCLGQAGNSPGATFEGEGTGVGAHFLGGADGHGAHFDGNGATRHGALYTRGGASGDDMAFANGDVTIGAVIGAVGSVTGNVGGNLLGTLSVSERNAIADAHLDRANGVETGVTPRQYMQRTGAVVAGRISGAGTTTEIFVGLDESTVRVTMIVDASGNRSDVVYV